ncbi:unnamed protein product [Microthlaspi erraticum]|uniref:Uncharacterized protein n=1 Tax=Microthlaspi erraticum TaxID=1685480 RepID=A0A6D2I0C2_9BRAS|nr:unnamed protein product [Microthlaspi erraticum]
MIMKQKLLCQTLPPFIALFLQRHKPLYRDQTSATPTSPLLVAVKTPSPTSLSVSANQKIRNLHIPSP